MPDIAIFFLASLALRYRRCPSHWKEGVVEELFVAGLLAPLLCRPLLIVLLFGCAVDDLLFTRFGARLRPSLSSHFLQPHLYWNSVAAMRREWIFPALFLAISWTLAGQGFYSWWGIVLLPLGLIRTPKDHWVLLALKEAMPKRAPKALPKRRPWRFPTEKARFLSHDYPLLRKTEEFRGEKLFSWKGSEKPHVVFLFLESFRAKNVGCLGAEVGLTPHFDALSREGVLFRNFYANSSGTSWSTIASLFGVPAAQNPSYLQYYVDLPLIGLPQILSYSGYQAAVIQGGDVSFQGSDAFYQTHGFQTIWGKKEILAERPHLGSSGWGVHDEGLLRVGAEWLQQQKTPTFLSLYTISNHHPWVRPSGWHPPTVASGTPFYETMAYSDWALGEMMLRWKRKSTLLFVFGDHGQGDQPLSEEQLHVPLLILGNGIKRQVIDEPCSQIDLLPTVLDLLQLEGPHHSVGTSLARKKRRFVCFSHPYEEGAIGCRLGRWKWLSKEGLFENGAPVDLPLRERRLQRMTEEWFGAVQDLYAGRAFAPASESQGNHVAPAKEISEDELMALVAQRRPLLSLDLSDCTRTAGAKVAERSLKKLRLSGSLRATDASVAKIVKGCPQLASLDLSHCPLLTLDVMGALHRLEHLEELHLEGVELGPIDTAPAQRLQRLSLPQVDPSWARWVGQLPLLKELKLGCSAWSDGDLPALTQPLQRLHLIGGEKLSSAALCALLGRARALSHLTLDGCAQIGNEFILALQGKPLRMLSLKNLPRLTDAGLTALHSFPLEWLLIDQCERVGADGLLALQREGLTLVVSANHLKQAEVERLRGSGIQVINFI